VEAEDELNVLRAEVDELQLVVADLINAITREATPPREVPQDMEPFLVWHGANPRTAEWVEWGKQSWSRRAAEDETRKDR
jgi:hypothetical protein